MKGIKYILLLLLPVLAITACKDDAIVENPSGETLIYNMYISNGGLSGGIRYNAVYDDATRTLTFNDVAAETDVQHIKFGGKISLGAHFDADSYDFYNPDAPNEKVLRGGITLTSGNNVTDYNVVINLSDPTSAPLVSKIEVKTSAGRVISGLIDTADKMIYLNAPNEEQVTLSSILLVPSRTSYTLTEADGNVISKNNPGTIELNFLGMAETYEISFSKLLPGINFSAPVIHDFTTNSTVWPDFVAEDTRSADFDGEHVLIVSRSGGLNPKLLKASDILSDGVVAPVALSTDGMAGGTYVISSGRLAQGHIYICNLTTGLADTDAGKLKLYHYADASSTPELVLDFNGVVDETITATGRFGDNMSLDLDENGNGYAYFVNHTGAGVLRFTITNFQTVGEAKFISDIASATYYACYNKVDKEDAYLFTSTTVTPIQLRDKDGGLLASIDKLGDAGHGTDAHVVNYNNGRYLMFTSGRQQSSWSFPTLYIYDISEGFSTVPAFNAYNEKRPDPVYTYKLGEATQAACTGITAWATVEGKLVILTAGPKAGFALIEFPKNEE
ncbi:DUF4623 domain-containing protein [Bacteroides sp.]